MNKYDFYEAEKEKWKDIPFAEGYQISDWGSVRKRNHKGVFKNQIILHSKRDWHLYIRINGESHKIQNLVAQAFVPNPNNYTKVIHIDGGNHNNTPPNLKWVE